MNDLSTPLPQGMLLSDPTEPSVVARGPSMQEQPLKVQQLTIWHHEIRDWLLTYPFTAKLVMRLKLVMVVDTRVPTACTDGAHVFVNAHFASQCSPALRRFVMAHELYHVLLGHFARQYGRDRQRWNLAVDAEANHRLMLDGHALPSDAVFYPSQAGRSAEVIYQWLLGHPHPSVDTPFDCHGDELFVPADKNRDTTELVIDPEYVPLTTNTEGVRRITQEWREAAIQIAQQTNIGSVPAGLQLVVRETPSPHVDWRSCLHDFFRRARGDSQTWNRVDRRHWGQGRYLPGRQGQSLSLMVAIDTSGSTRRALPSFITELRTMMASSEHVELHLIECDATIQRERVITQFHELQDLDDADELDALALLGGGGTDFRPVFERAEMIMPDCVVYLTDGHGRVPERTPSMPVLWVLTEYGTRPTSWGHNIQMGERE